MNGKGEARQVKIDRALVKPDDAEVLEDLILAAINDNKAKAEEKSREEMQKLTGGLQLPPGFRCHFDGWSAVDVISGNLRTAVLPPCFGDGLHCH